MMALADPAPALVSAEQLRSLTNQVGQSSCQEYITNYISLWDDRFDRLCRAVISADDEAAMDVVLSIRISSQMAGAERLATLAHSAQHLLAHSGVAELATMIAGIAVCGRETMTCLLTTLD